MREKILKSFMGIGLLALIIFMIFLFKFRIGFTIFENIF